MGKRGTKTEPTALKILKGNPGKRPLPKNEPKPTGDMPDPPSHLDEYALEEWNRVCDGLHAMGVLYGVDMATLAAYCASYSRWRTADEELQKLTMVLSDPDNPESEIIYQPLRAMIEITKAGNMIQHPLVGTSNVAKSDCIKYAAQLGMTPSARASLGIDPKQLKKSKFMGLISSGKK